MGFQQALFLNMLAGSTLINLSIFKRDAAKTDKQAAILNNGFPAGLIIDKASEVAQNMRDNNLSSSKAIGIDRFGIAANAI